MGSYNIVNAAALVTGQPEDISIILSNFQAIQTVLNGGIDNSNINAAAAILASKIAGYPADGTKVLLGDGTWGTFAGGGSGLTGEITMYGGPTAPVGWAMCDGSSQLRTGTYAALFGVIGAQFGAVDGTHFNLPDFVGRVPVGLGTHADVNAINKNDGLPAASRTIRHRHTKNGAATLTGANSTLFLTGANSSLFLGGGNSSLGLSGVSAFSSVPGSGGVGTGGGDRALVEGFGLSGANSSLGLGGANSSIGLAGANSSIGISDTITIGPAGTPLDSEAYIVIPIIIKL